MCDWFTTLSNSKKSCIADGNLKKVHYQLENGQELVEEYNTDTDTLTRRAWKRKEKFAGEGDWEVEIGDAEPQICTPDTIIKEHSSQPFISRRNTRKILEWRIRNLPYSVDVYSVTVDGEKRCMHIRTSNKKYYKVLKIPELDRLNLPLEQDRITFQHKFNTLIIIYEKPSALADFEKKILEEVRKLKPKDCGDFNNCKPS